jgi:hypothetical protein
MKVPLYSVPTADVRGWMNLSQLKDLVSLQSLKLLFRSHEYRVRLQYEIIGHWSYFAEQTLFMNMGYWDSSTTSLDDACRAMARMVGERGEFSPQDQILDAGFGFADQDMFWIDTFAPRRIDGVNISPTQVRTGRKRVAERGLDSRIQLSMASATALPFEDRSFSKVVSLESARRPADRDRYYLAAGPSRQQARAEAKLLRARRVCRKAEPDGLRQRRGRVDPRANLSAVHRLPGAAAPRAGYCAADQSVDAEKFAGFRQRCRSLRRY